MSWFRLSPEADDGIGGRVSPPSNWAALVGDPAVTRNRADSNLVYMSDVAVPRSKFPFLAGRIEGELERSDLPSSFCGGYVGGGCIARSTDDGRTFSLSNADCVSRTSAGCPNGDVYVGSDLETSPEGRVYAAFTDRSRNRVDVYMATSPTGSFARVTDRSRQRQRHEAR